MSIDSMTIGELRSIQNLLGGTGTSLPIKPGEKWLFRGVTNYAIGEVVEVRGDCIELRNASWVADTGRFSEAMATGNLREVEHQEHRCLVNWGAVCDAFAWPHALPEVTR